MEVGGDVRRLPDTGTFMHASDVTPDGRLAVAGGVQWKVNADQQDLVQKRVSPTTPHSNPCGGETKSPIWLVNVAQPDKSVFAAVCLLSSSFSAAFSLRSL